VHVELGNFNEQLLKIKSRKDMINEQHRTEGET